MASAAMGNIPLWWDPNGEGLCVWSAYQPKGALNFASSLIDLTGNGNNAGDPGGANTPAWDAINGWGFDGLNDYIMTTFVPQNDQSQSALVQFTNVGNVNTVLFGSQSLVNRVFAIIPDRAITSTRYFNGGNITTVPGLLNGNLGIGGNQGYRNGLPDGGAIGAWAGVPIGSVYIGAYFPGNAANCQVQIQAFALYDCVLTPPQMLAVATAMAAL